MKICPRRWQVVFLAFLILGVPGRADERVARKLPREYVNPFIGTDDMGHTFPGAAVPFGLVQLSPETDDQPYNTGNAYNKEVYRYCAGYQYADKTIVGFSHTHFNGTGHSDLGDIRLMPITGPLRLDPGPKDDPDSGYRSRFSHEREKAEPGYYRVRLDDYGIEAELTATERCGFHRYSFPVSSEARIILDLTAGLYNYEGKTIWSFVRVESPTLVTGYVQTSGWARTRSVYFAMEFSRPVKSYGLVNGEQPVYKGFWRKWNEGSGFPERAGRKVKGHFEFDTEGNGVVMVKVGISGVSAANARENLQAGIPGWDFDGTKTRAAELWDQELSKIVIEAGEDMKADFYTAMYHAFLSPSIFSDVNGQYRGLDQNVHTANAGGNYTVFSLWDTYRALHPLFTMIQERRAADMVGSMLAHYEQSVHHILPIWSHWANENWCMIGYHAVPVIADAYMKGLGGFDRDEAFKAVLASAGYDPYDGIGAYRKLGYVPEDVSPNSASKTLEYAYDDWTIMRFAEKLGRLEAAAEFRRRALNYRNVFDPGTGFMRARNSDGTWKTSFDPLSVVGQGFIEGNSWNYSLYVPHDVNGLMTLLGGPDKLVSWLDSLFDFKLPEKYLTESEDVTRVGLIGNYVHGNEPSHHIPYLYCYAGRPWKTQEMVRRIVREMYKPEPHGLCGNDDCGQMSAWYIFSVLGFYPVAPGSDEYVIGSPSAASAVIRLEGGRTFKVVAENQGPGNVYIGKALLNGKPFDRCYITHEELTRGGELQFFMGSKPNKKWGVGPGAVPYSLSAPGR